MSPSRICFLTVLVCCKAFGAFSQGNNSRETFQAFNEHWKAIDNIKKATYFSRTKKINDTCWVVNMYNVMGPMIKKEVYKDKAQKIAHGSWAFYNPRGYIDSICTFKDNLAHGNWYFNDSLLAYTQKDYENGRLIAVHARINRKDSANVKEKEPELKAGEESMFPGPPDAWSKYLSKNLVYPERAFNAGKAGMVVVQFIVNKDGGIEEIDVYKSVEFSLDEEAVRMIVKSPRWIAAVQDGKKVKSYKRQPIVYGFRK